MRERQIMEMLRAALGSVPEETRIELCICDERLACGCRKPAPGLLLRLLDRFGVSPAEALSMPKPHGGLASPSCGQTRSSAMRER